ncbi:hypothetical protein [Aureimonas sp. D3]|uniref:hypothetical protein n=1 Tax=Aureimonas sp. D3 TaxID=1638164 RepID=UPI0012E34BD1|nr:hypothetical protein [Aureimonas sp. D3]
MNSKEKIDPTRLRLNNPSVPVYLSRTRHYERILRGRNSVSLRSFWIETPNRPVKAVRVNGTCQR